MSRVAALAMLVWLMRFGSEVVSTHVPPSSPVWLPTCVPLEPQLVVPTATPWQYWTSIWPQELPPTLPKKPLT